MMFGLFGRSRRKPAPAPRKGARLSLEPLERRDLLAVAPITLSPVPFLGPGTGATVPAPQPPSRVTIVSFEAIEVAPGIWTFQGQVSGQGVAGQQVSLGGFPGLQGRKLTIQQDGSFSLTIRLPVSLDGTATAQTGGSNLALTPVWSTD
jgi:hypothetical protein